MFFKKTKYPKSGEIWRLRESEHTVLILETTNTDVLFILSGDKYMNTNKLTKKLSEFVIYYTYFELDNLPT